MNCDIFVCLHMQTDCLKNKLFWCKELVCENKACFPIGYDTTV